MIGRISISLGLMAMTGLGLHAQTYKVSDIRPEWRNEARAVVRESQHQIELKDINHSHSRIHEVISVLEPAGVDRAYFAQKVDELNKVRFIEGKVYDKDGKLIKTLTAKDINVHELNGSYTTAAGTKVMVFKPVDFEYPFTIEYTYEMDKSGFLTLLKWDPVRFGKIGVEKATMELSNSSGIAVKSRQHLDGKWENEPWVNGNKTWTVSNYLSDYGGGKLPPELSKNVTLVPKSFKIDGKEGSYESWASFGAWINELNAGRQELPADFKNQIQTMTAGMSDMDKVRTLYEFMQNYTQFVNVSKGTASWIPISATDVHRTRKGDCKALTNYMKSMLDVVGIESHYSLVRAGKRNGDIPADFPINHFNHVILAVNVDGQTIWLENTNPENPFGYLSDFTRGKTALMIDGQNSRLSKTRSTDKYVATGKVSSKTPEESMMN